MDLIFKGASLAMVLFALSTITVAGNDCCSGKNISCGFNEECINQTASCLANSVVDKLKERNLTTATNFLQVSNFTKCIGAECCCTDSASMYCIKNNLSGGLAAKIDQPNCAVNLTCSSDVYSWACGYKGSLTGSCQRVDDLTCSFAEFKLLSRREQVIYNRTLEEIKKMSGRLLRISSNVQSSVFERVPGTAAMTLMQNGQVQLMLPANAKRGVFSVITKFADKNEDLKAPSLEKVKNANLDLGSGAVSFIGRNTSIVVISLYDESGNPLKKRVKFTINMSSDQTVDQIYPGKILKKVKKSCMFLNGKEWDDSVCTTIEEKSSVTCNCDHNSAFAVVFSARFIDDIPQDIITLSVILQIVSLMFLVVTIVILFYYRTRCRNFDRVLVQINLSIALFFTHLFFLLGPSARSQTNACTAIAGLTHFFLISSAMLMVMEGTLMLVKVLVPHSFTNNQAKKRRFIGVLVAWILPFVYVVLCVAFGTFNDIYLQKPHRPSEGLFEKCWVAFGFLKYVVIIPVAIALTINTCISIRLGLIVWKMSRKAENFKPSNLRDQDSASHAGKAFRAVILLFPALGVPWLLGFLVNIQGPETLFATIHIVVNGLQGMMIFIIYVVLSKELRHAIKRSWDSSSSSMLPSIHFVSTSNTSI